MLFGVDGQDEGIKAFLKGFNMEEKMGEDYTEEAKELMNVYISDLKILKSRLDGFFPGFVGNLRAFLKSYDEYTGVAEKLTALQEKMEGEDKEDE